MKKIIVFLAILLSNKIFAQITLTRADFPKPTATSPMPDSVLMTTVTAPTTTAQTVNGANQTWNESSLSGIESYQKFVAPLSTPPLLAIQFLTSDFALNLTGGFGGGFSVTEGYEYYNYNATNTRLEIKGTGFSITPPTSPIGIPISAVYDNADVIYRFPVTYGDADSSVSNYTTNINIPISGTITINADIIRHQKRVNHVDAWGSMTTPAGTFNVLRVASNLTRVDSVVSTFITQGFPSNTTEYKWLANGKKIPILQINENNNTATVTNATFWGAAPAPASTNNVALTKNSVSLFPNPTIENTTIQYEVINETPVDIFITTMDGKTVAEFHFANKQKGVHKEYVPVQNLPKGLYQVSCKAGKDVLSAKLLKL